MEPQQKNGFAFDGLSITGWIDVSRKADVQQANDIGISLDSVNVERRRISIPLELVGPHYESKNDDGEPITVVWSAGNDWHLWGSYDDFRALLAAAYLAREAQGKGPMITIPGGSVG